MLIVRDFLVVWEEFSSDFSFIFFIWLIAFIRAPDELVLEAVFLRTSDTFYDLEGLLLSGVNSSSGGWTKL
jgi:hypothetical protein